MEQRDLIGREGRLPNEVVEIYRHPASRPLRLRAPNA